MSMHACARKWSRKTKLGSLNKITIEKSTFDCMLNWTSGCCAASLIEFDWWCCLTACIHTGAFHLFTTHWTTNTWLGLRKLKLIPRHLVPHGHWIFWLNDEPKTDCLLAEYPLWRTILEQKREDVAEERKAILQPLSRSNTVIRKCQNTIWHTLKNYIYVCHCKQFSHWKKWKPSNLIIVFVWDFMHRV